LALGEDTLSLREDARLPSCPVKLRFHLGHHEKQRQISLS